MKILIGEENREAAALLPPTRPDGSGIGVNFVEEAVRPFNTTLPDGRAIALRRRGLKLVLQVGDRTGEALLRRLENGPDPRTIFTQALSEAGRSVGVSFYVDEGSIWMEEI